MFEHRSNHRNVLLPNGSVLVVGGTTLESGFLAENEVYDPNTGEWTVSSVVMNENRTGHSANILPDATVFVAGGLTGTQARVLSAQLVDRVGAWESRRVGVGSRREQPVALGQAHPRLLGQLSFVRHLTRGYR